MYGSSGSEFCDRLDYFVEFEEVTCFVLLLNRKYIYIRDGIIFRFEVIDCMMLNFYFDMYYNKTQSFK